MVGDSSQETQALVFKAAEQHQAVSAHTVGTQGFEKLGSKLAPNGAPQIRGPGWSDDGLQICALRTPRRKKRAL